MDMPELDFIERGVQTGTQSIDLYGGVHNKFTIVAFNNEGFSTTSDPFYFLSPELSEYTLNMLYGVSANFFH